MMAGRKAKHKFSRARQRPVRQNAKGAGRGSDRQRGRPEKPEGAARGDGRRAAASGNRTTLALSPGKFYVARNGERWCCYRLRPDDEPHMVAYCIRVSDSRLEYFYLDGRYDHAGDREHTLIKECEP